MADWIINQCIAGKEEAVAAAKYSSVAPLEKIAIAGDRMKTRYDRAANLEGFHEGHLVLFYNSTGKKRLSPKLQTSWGGRYKIVQDPEKWQPLYKNESRTQRATVKIGEER